MALIAAIAAAGGTLLLFTIPAVMFQVVVLIWKVRVAQRLLPLRCASTGRVGLRCCARRCRCRWLRAGHALLPRRLADALAARHFEAVGIYGVSYKFIDIVHFAGAAVTVPLLTVLVRSWPDDLPAFRGAVRRGAMLLALLGGLAVTGLVGFAEPLTRLLYGTAYAAGADTTRDPRRSPRCSPSRPPSRSAAWWPATGTGSTPW